MNTDDPRFLRGLALARAGAVRQLRRAMWAVRSASHTGSYLVSIAEEISSCECPDFEAHNEAPEFACKHIYACRIHTKSIEIPTGMTDDRNERRTYSQSWAAYEAAQLNERMHFESLLRDLCGGIVQPKHERGRRPVLLADVVFAAVQRCYSGLSSRRAHSDVCSAADAGFIDHALSPKTLVRYLEDERLTDLLRTLVRESAAPLAGVEDRFAVDSTGFSTNTYSRWFDHKWGKERKRQQWIKCHVICGVQTHVVCDVIVTLADGADAPQLPELVANTAERFTMTEVSADKAYLSHRNFDAIERVGAVPYIPYKVGNTGEGPDLWRRMWALYQYKRDTFLARYHARSNVETVFSMIKRKFGAAVRAKTATAQRNEVLCKVLAHNICVLIASMYELGTVAEFGHERDGGGHVH